MSTKTTKSKKKAIWAMDPFEDSPETRKQVLSTLDELSRQGFEITPVYVFNSLQYGLAGIEPAAPWIKQNAPTVKRMAAHSIEGVRSEAQIGNLQNPIVLTEDRPSTRSSVKALGNYAKLHGAEMIVVGTHGRQGIVRFFMGSFAETLLLYSKVPVLVVGPHSEHTEARTILFPTDLGKLSKSVFNRTLALARARQARIILLHVLPRPTETFLQNGVYLFSGAYMAWPDFVTAAEQRQRKLAERYVQAGKKAGVEVSVIFDPEHTSVSQSILEHAQKEHVQMIAMRGESGVIASNLLGSITRQVARSAPCPVWVTRSAP